MNERLSREAAVVGDVGRTGVRLALTDDTGQLRRDSIRTYDAASTTTVSGALSMFKRDAGLAALPRRCALAVAGMAHGNTISITNSRWFISRSGLQSMLQHPPVIINDFAAQAWAISGADRRAFEMIQGPLVDPGERPGCYCVLGMTTGLGVAVLKRSRTGAITVLSTEMGHAGFVSGSDEVSRAIAAIFPDRAHVIAEDVLSAPGLLALYSGLARIEGVSPIARTPEEVTRDAATDHLAARACTLLCQAFWSFAGNAVLSFGAWDGVFVTGKLAAAMRPMLRRIEMQEQFALKGSYARVLREVPRTFATLDHCELTGAAEALRQTDAALAGAALHAAA